MLKRMTIVCLALLALTHCTNEPKPSPPKHEVNAEPTYPQESCATNPCLCPESGAYQSAKDLLYKNEIITNGSCIAPQKLAVAKKNIDCQLDPCTCESSDPRADQVISINDTAHWSSSGLQSQNVLINIQGSACAKDDTALKRLVCDQLSSAAGCPNAFSSPIAYQETCLQTPALCAQPTIHTQVLTLKPIGSLANASDINKERPLICKRIQSEDQSWSDWQTIQTGYVAEHPDMPGQPGGQMDCQDESLLIQDPNNPATLSLSELYQYLQDERAQAGYSTITTVTLSGLEHNMTVSATDIRKIITTDHTLLSNKEILDQVCQPEDTLVTLHYHSYDNGLIIAKKFTFNPYHECMDKPTKMAVIAEKTCALDVCECPDELSQLKCTKKQAIAKAGTTKNCDLIVDISSHELNQPLLCRIRPHNDHIIDTVETAVLTTATEPQYCEDITLHTDTDTRSQYKITELIDQLSKTEQLSIVFTLGDSDLTPHSGYINIHEPLGLSCKKR